MRRGRGFALAVFLMLMPVIALMTWSFLKLGSSARIQAVTEERKVRALQAAEAGLRRYLTTQQSSDFELNGCVVSMNVSEVDITVSAIPLRSYKGVTIRLQIEKGFIMGRLTNEKN